MFTYICMKAQRRTDAVYSLFLLVNLLFSYVFSWCCTKLYFCVEQRIALLPQSVVQFVVEQLLYLLYFSTSLHFIVCVCILYVNNNLIRIKQDVVFGSLRFLSAGMWLRVTCCICRTWERFVGTCCPHLQSRCR